MSFPFHLKNELSASCGHNHSRATSDADQPRSRDQQLPTYCPLSSLEEPYGLEPQYATIDMKVHVEPVSAHSDEPSIEENEQRNEDNDVDAEHEVDDLADSKPKKKRRVVKTSDKKYECPHADCGKAYSRAEHLYRHQLNRKFMHRRITAGMYLLTSV